MLVTLHLAKFPEELDSRKSVRLVERQMDTESMNYR